MSLTLNTSSAGNSPSSDGSSALPLTPDSHTASLPAPVNHSAPASATDAGPTKRKPSRRANTAERRATHNAVERQRRETLNGRFLDLAGLLPNLSQIRRPSKSSIVNSSIAHVHAARRHRLLASRELRALKAEADSLRRELNEWRDRAQLPRVEEPVRSEGFTMVLSGEVEVLTNIPGEEEDDEGGLNYDGYDEATDEFAAIGSAVSSTGNVFAHNVNGNAAQHIPTPPRSAGGPMIATAAPTVSYENPAMSSLYEPHPHQQPSQFPGAASAPFMQQQPLDMDKWGSHLFPNQRNNSASNAALFTPPSSATSNGASFADHSFFASMQRQQQMMNGMSAAHGHGHGHMYSSPEADDLSSSSSSSVSGRERSGSGSGGYGTPPNFDLGSLMGNSSHSSNRRTSTGLHINTGGLYSDGMGLGMMKQAMATSPPISVGGGGNGNGFMSMMF